MVVLKFLDLIYILFGYYGGHFPSIFLGGSKLSSMKNNSTLMKVFLMTIGLHILYIVGDIARSLLLHYIGPRDPSKKIGFKMVFLVKKIKLMA